MLIQFHLELKIWRYYSTIVEWTFLLHLAVANYQPNSRVNLVTDTAVDTVSLMHTENGQIVCSAMVPFSGCAYLGDDDDRNKHKPMVFAMHWNIV